MKPQKAAFVGGVVAALLFLVGCGGGGSDDGSSSPVTVVHRVGEPVRHGDLEVVLHAVTNPFDSGNPVVKAPPGFRQLAVEVEVKNLSSKPQIFSPFAQFELRDSTGKLFNPTPLPRNVPAFNGGDAPPGSAQRGLIAFQVPEASTGLQIVFQNPVITEGSVTFNLA